MIRPNVLLLGGCLISAGFSEKAEAAEMIAGTAAREAIRNGLPKYDPMIRQDHLTTLKKSAGVAVEGAQVYGVKQGSTVTLQSAQPADTVIALPRIIVRPTNNTAQAEPAIQLPRIVVVRPAGKEVKPEAFETPAARDERLVKKHLSAFDRFFLNRFTFLGVSKEQRAREAEAIEQSARRLSEIADLLELSRSGKPETAEDRKLNEAYLDAFVSRPK